MRKKVPIICLTILLIAAGIFLSFGFRKCTSPVLTDFLLSPYEDSMTLEAAPSSSMGYIRMMRTDIQDGRAYLTFYHTFGGPNSSLGARNRFTFSLPEDCTEVYFFRGKDDFRLVLRKNPNTGHWEKL